MTWVWNNYTWAHYFLKENNHEGVYQRRLVADGEHHGEPVTSEVKNVHIEQSN